MSTIQWNIKNQPIQLVLNVCNRNKDHPPPRSTESPNQQTKVEAVTTCILLGKFKHLFRHFTGSLMQYKIKL